MDSKTCSGVWYLGGALQVVVWPLIPWLNSLNWLENPKFFLDSMIIATGSLTVSDSESTVCIILLLSSQVSKNSESPWHWHRPVGDYCPRAPGHAAAARPRQRGPSSPGPQYPAYASPLGELAEARRPGGPVGSPPVTTRSRRPRADLLAGIRLALSGCTPTRSLRLSAGPGFRVSLKDSDRAAGHGAAAVRE